MTDLLANSTLMDAIDGVAYVVDAAGMIIALGGRQLSAGQRSRDDRFEPSVYIGKPLDMLIKGVEVRNLYQRLLNRVTKEGRGSVSFQCQCDRPDARRTMRISITPLSLGSQGQGVLFQSIILSEEMRPKVPLLEKMNERFAEDPSSVFPEETIVSMCSFCQRLSLQPNETDPEWLAPEDYYRRGGRSDVLISHGICADCYGELSTD